MKALVYYNKEDLRLEEIAKPKIEKPDQVLIKVHYAGVCGSEIARIIGDHPIPLENPVPHGHEFAGVVEGVGSGVTSLKKGDKVAVAPKTVCGICEDCLNNRVGQCANTKGFIGVKLAGGWAEYCVVSEQNAVRLPVGVTTFGGAFLEPLTVAVHAAELVEFKPGRSCAIVGVGTIGMLMLQVAAAYGAVNLTAFDISDYRLELALSDGAKHIVKTNGDWLKQAREITKGRFYEYVIETGGSVFTEKAAITLAGAHGTLIYVGTPGSEICFSPAEFEEINRKELWIRGSWQSYSTPFPGVEWKIAAEMLQQKKVKLDGLVDRIIPMDALFDALEDVRAGKVQGKIMLRIADDADTPNYAALRPSV